MVYSLRRPATYIALILTVIASTIVLAKGSAKAADLECAKPGAVSVCIDISGDALFASLSNDGADSQFNDWTLVIIQCSGAGTNCGALRATSDQDPDEWGATVTKTADGGFGHTYKAVASWTESPSGTHWVSVNTPLVCCPD